MAAMEAMVLNQQQLLGLIKGEGTSTLKLWEFQSRVGVGVGPVYAFIFSFHFLCCFAFLFACYWYQVAPRRVQIVRCITVHCYLSSGSSYIQWSNACITTFFSILNIVVFRKYNEFLLIQCVFIDIVSYVNILSFVNLVKFSTIVNCICSGLHPVNREFCNSQFRNSGFRHLHSDSYSIQRIL